MNGLAYNNAGQWSDNQVVNRWLLKASLQKVFPHEGLTNTHPGRS